MHLNGECVIRLRLPLPRLLLLLFVQLFLFSFLSLLLLWYFSLFFAFVVVAFLVIRTFYACLRAIHVVVALFVVVLLFVVVVLVVWHLALASSSGCSSTYSKQLHTPCMAVCVFVLAPLCVFVCVFTELFV